MATPPSTTIVPFATLPSCAAKCGPLYDANGACVPPVNPSTDKNSWTSCFCSYGSLQPLKSGPNDICSGSCSADPQGLPGIQSWFASFCNAAPVATGTSTTSPTPSGGSSGKKNNGGGDWASTHVNWIVFIVVVVVAIVGIWTGACIWRRKYLKRKDRLHELGKGLPSTVAVNTPFVGGDARDSTISNGPGLFMSGPGGSGRSGRRS